MVRFARPIVRCGLRHVFSDVNLQSLMMISGLSLLCWLFIRSRFKQKRKTQPLVVNTQLKHNSNAVVSTPTFSGVASSGAPREVLRWQVEMHDLARELKAELDSKIVAVRAVTRSYEKASSDLDARIERLESLMESQIPLASRIQKLREAGWTPPQLAEAFGCDISVVEEMAETKDS